MNIKLIPLICCVSLSLFLVSCGGSSSSTTSALTESELNILSGIVKAPASLVSGDTGSSSNIILAESTTVEIPLTGASVCLYDAVTGYAYVKADFKTRLCGTTDASGGYSVDYSHLVAAGADISMIRGKATKIVSGSGNSVIGLSAPNIADKIVIQGVVVAGSGNDLNLNINIRSHVSAMHLDKAIAQTSAENLKRVRAGTDLSPIRETLKRAFPRMKASSSVSSIPSSMFVYSSSQSSSEQRMVELERALSFTAGNSVLTSEESVQIQGSLDTIYSSKSNFQDNTQLVFGFTQTCNSEHCKDLYMPKKLDQGLFVSVGKGANVARVTQWADGTTFDHGANCGDIQGTVKNMRVGDCENFDATKAESSFRAIDGFYAWAEAAAHRGNFKLDEMMEIGQEFLNVVGGCIDADTFERSFEVIEFGESDKEYMAASFCTTGENAVKLDRTDFEAALTDLTQFMQYGYDADFVDTRDCGAHFDDYGNLRDSAPQYCYEEYGRSMEQYQFFDPVRECWDESGINLSTYNSSMAQNECPYVLRDFRNFTKYELGAETTTLDVSVAEHLMFICGWYGIWDEATQEESLHPSAPQGCAVYSQVNMEEFNTLEECWLQDGTAKALDTLTGFAKHGCKYFQEYVNGMTGSTALNEKVFSTLEPWLKRDLCDNYMEIENNGSFSFREEDVPPICKNVDLTEGFTEYMTWEEEEWSIITECYDGVNVKENQDCGYLPKVLDLTNTIVLKDICDRFFNWDYNNPGFQTNAPAGCAPLLDYFSCRIKGDIYNDAYWAAMYDPYQDSSNISYFNDSAPSECKGIEELSKCLDFVWIDECDGTYMFDHNISATCEPIYKATSVDAYVPRTFNTMYCTIENEGSSSYEMDTESSDYITIEDSFVRWDSCNQFPVSCDTTDYKKCYEMAEDYCNRDGSCEAFSVRKAPGHYDDYIIYTGKDCVHDYAYQDIYWNLHIKERCDYGEMDDCGVCNGPGPRLWYEDRDGDGVGDSPDGVKSCFRPENYVSHYQASLSYLGEGECRQSNVEYPAKFSVSYHDLRPHTEGDNAKNAENNCKETCDRYSWCVAAEVVLRDIWPSPECRLVTDYSTFTGAGMSFQNDSWGGTQNIDGTSYQTYCAGGGASCTTRKIGEKVSLYDRDGYHCYVKP